MPTYLQNVEHIGRICPALSTPGPPQTRPGRNMNVIALEANPSI
jgi:hypothetical protein